MADPELGRDPAGLRDSLRQSPLLAVLRSRDALQADRQISAVAAAGFLHVELAFSPQQWWAPLLQQLPLRWPQLRFGVAGLRDPEQLELLCDLPVRFAMAPVACELMLERAEQLGFTLVPGVFSPTEVHRFAGARHQGPVKLFPAATLGPAYWRQLAGPLGPLPFCIAAGGLGPEQLSEWFAAGVQAVALGSSLFSSDDRLKPGHAELLEPYLG